ncbi:hypothetical protein KAR91_53080 [Candidatus Pacearchaeota archaeon]|nr:hypothetical protein [Candidatus Pacearchaeota archaeon]
MRKRLGKKKMKKAAELAAQWYIENVEVIRANARAACIRYGGRLIDEVPDGD